MAVTTPNYAQDSPRPNFVIIICDDLGYGDLASYGHPVIQTPNLDRMAAQGVRFTDFYSTAPVCSASRVGLMTGRSPNRAGVYDWIPAANQPRPDGRELVHMRETETTLPQLLKRAGYATAMAGKWHCNSRFNSPEQPQPNHAGFDHWFATQNNARPSHANPDNFVRNGEPVGLLKGYSCQLVADEGLAWLENQRRRDADQPFLLYLAFHEPHEPVASPEELVQRYMPEAKNRFQAEYFANVHNVDLAVGKVLDGLKRLGVDDNTLVVFTSDNGPETLLRYRGAEQSYGVATPLRGMKLWTTDAGFRVAGIMRWPDGIKAGQVSSQPVSALDLLPTFCDLAGAGIPAGLALDGANFLPALTGQPIQREKPLIWAFYNAINEERVAMRHGDWKMLAKLDGGDLPKMQNVHVSNVAALRSAKLTDFELYRITEDVSETNTVNLRYPEQFEQLKKQLIEGYAELLRVSPVWGSE
ncbi:MAG: sulfatase family protein [Planctomycetota bacterium]